MFELNDEEIQKISRCKNFTLNAGRGSNIKYKPYVFTEQGIYAYDCVTWRVSSADEVFESIYRKAKSTIYIVDNYIGPRTLVHLKNTPAGVQSIIFSDNFGANKLHSMEFNDFCKEYPNVQIKIQKTGGKNN